MIPNFLIHVYKVLFGEGSGRLEQVPDENSILVFSFAGYLSQEVVVGKRTVPDIALKVDGKALGEVVVVGHGTQKRRDRLFRSCAYHRQSTWGIRYFLS